MMYAYWEIYLMKMGIENKTISVLYLILYYLQHLLTLSRLLPGQLFLITSFNVSNVITLQFFASNGN